MAHTSLLRQRAIQLRQEGTSIPGIAKQLSIAKSTASYWVRSISLSERFQKHLLSKRLEGCEKGREVMRMRRLLENEKHAKEMSALISRLQKKINKDFWKLFAAILFWCEGGKRQLNQVTFTNSDPALVSIFLFAVRGGFELDENKFRIVLHLHSYHEEIKQKLFWSNVTGISTSQFTKSYHKPHTKVRRREGYQGCVSLKYFDARIAKKLDALYHAFAKKFTGAW